MNIQEKTTKEVPHIEGVRRDSERRPFLVVISGVHAGEVHAVGEEGLVIGRGQECPFVLLDEGVSRRHCQLVARGDGVQLQDLDSTNGTLVNGDSITESLLADGDKIQVGSVTVLKFTYFDDLENSFARQMYESALRDGLTRVFNKRYFDGRLDAEFAFARRHETPLTLCLFDLDHFKRVNDEHGHLAGDYVLRSLALQVAGSLRSEDVLARFGGEEFVVLSRGITTGGALLMAERVRRMIERHPLRWKQRPLSVTASFGVAGLPAAIETPEALIEAADRALYAAKEQGRNRVCEYDPQAHTKGSRHD